MDTIIYVYLKRECGNTDNVWEDIGSGGKGKREAKYLRQDVDMGDYRLVRVGVSSELWRILREKAAENKEEEQQSRSRFPIGRKRKRKEAERLQRLRRLEEEGCRREFAAKFLEDSNHSYFAADEPIPSLEGWSFKGYCEEAWVMYMMRHASLNHFVILGKAACIPRILLQYVRGMKGMCWVLQRSRYGEQEQELVDMLYEEYGLAAEIRLLEEERDFCRLRLAYRIPVVVVDFCEEEKLSGTDMARGSIWLDMTSSEKKRHRIEDGSRKISYFSLKKEWKEAEKAPYQLDTISKNRYNT